MKTKFSLVVLGGSAALFFLVRNLNAPMSREPLKPESVQEVPGQKSRFLAKFVRSSPRSLNSNEIVAAYVKQQIVDQTNVWYRAEHDGGDLQSLRMLSKLALKTNRTEFKALVSRIIANTNYLETYRLEALGTYAGVTDGLKENSAVPQLIEQLEFGSPVIANMAFYTLTMLVTKPEVRESLPLFEAAAAKYPENRNLAVFANGIRNDLGNKK